MNSIDEAVSSGVILSPAAAASHNYQEANPESWYWFNGSIMVFPYCYYGHGGHGAGSTCCLSAPGVDDDSFCGYYGLLSEHGGKCEGRVARLSDQKARGVNLSDHKDVVLAVENNKIVTASETAMQDFSDTALIRYDMYDISCCHVPYVWEYFKCGDWNVKVIADSSHVPLYGWCSNSGTTQWRHFSTNFSADLGCRVCAPCKCTPIPDYANHTYRFNYSPLSNPPAHHDNTYWVSANLIADSSQTDWGTVYYSGQTPCGDGKQSYVVGRKTGTLLEWQCYEINTNPKCWTLSDYKNNKHNAVIRRGGNHECSSVHKYGQAWWFSMKTGAGSTIKAYYSDGSLITTIGPNSSFTIETATGNSAIYFDFL